jgi:TldD protein
MKDFLAKVINHLQLKGVEYGDCRLEELETQELVMKNGVAEVVNHRLNRGFGVRCLKNKGWGFASSAILSPRERDRVLREAFQIAQASSLVRGVKRQELSTLGTQRGYYRTRMEKDPFEVSLDEKLKLMSAVDRTLRSHPAIKLTQVVLSFSKTRKLFASTEGSFTDQEIVTSGGKIIAYTFKDGEFQFRSYGNFAQSGYEFVESLKLLERAPKIGAEAVELLTAVPCPQVTTDIILDSQQLALQVHESCGHPCELDRVLGAEESFAGTSFLKIDTLGRFRYGSDRVSIYADATIPGGLGSFGFDDEGVPAQRFPLVKEGIHTGYLTSRETGPVIGVRSNGAMRASSWARIPLIRMTNINLEPGDWQFEDLLADTAEGVYMATNRSWSIDNRRLNFQFGTEIAFKIHKGKLGQIYRNPIYFGITPKFWMSCDAVCRKEDWVLWGIPNCGKGEPGQLIKVGHGTSPARFRKVEIGGAV